MVAPASPAFAFAPGAPAEKKQTRVFDAEAARADGYSDAEISSFLSKENNFDRAGALKDGYTDDHIISFLAPPPPAPEPEPETSGTAFGMAKGYASGLINMVGGAVTGVGRTAQTAGSDSEKNARENKERILAAFDVIDSNKPVPKDMLKDNRGNKLNPGIFTDYINASPEDRKAQKDEFAKSLAEGDVVGHALTVGGRNVAGGGGMISKFGEDLLTDEERQRTSVKFASMMGGLTGLIGSAAAGGMPAIMGVAGMEGYGEAYNAAKNTGQTDEQAATAGTLNGLVQAGMMAVPLHTALKIVDKLPGAAKSSLLKGLLEIGKSSATMVGFSQLNTLASNAVAQATFDPSRKLTDGLGEDIGIQAVAGAILPIAMVGGRMGVHATRKVIADKVAARAERDAADVEKIFDSDDTGNVISAAAEASGDPDAQPAGATTAEVPVAGAAPRRPGLDFNEIMGRSAGEETPGATGLGAALTDADRITQQGKLVKLFQSMNEGTVEQHDDGTATYTTKDGKVVGSPVEIWDPSTPAPDGSKVQPDTAMRVQAYLKDKYGINTVWLHDEAGVHTDGAFDKNQPDTVFLSNNPSRAMTTVAGHEIGHLFESIKAPDTKDPATGETIPGKNLGEVLDETVKEEMTSAGWQQADDLFSKSMPDRAGFDPGAKGDEDHAYAVMGHFVNEMAKEGTAEAPMFQSVIDKTMEKLRSRFGDGVANDMVGKFLTGIKTAMENMRVLFSVDVKSKTRSQDFFNNLDRVHDVIAEMQAAKFGEKFEADRAAAAEKTATHATDLAAIPPEARAGPVVTPEHAAALERERQSSGAAFTALDKLERSILHDVDNDESRLSPRNAELLATTRTIRNKITRLREGGGLAPLGETPGTKYSPRQTTEEERVKAHHELAMAQRGEPEYAMLKAQRALGGGVLSNQLEHVGDLTHRIAEKGGIFGSEFVTPKVERAIKALTRPYGFEREHRENMEGNRVEPDVEKAALQEYTDAHKALPVYNRVQELGRNAAIHLGEKNFPAALRDLRALDTIIKSGNYDAENRKHDPQYELRQGDNRVQFSPRQEETPEFKAWFGGSKAVDKDGKPLVLYHGTSKDKDFSTINVPKNGVWLTEDRASASTYATENDSQGHRYEGGKFEPTNTAARVMPLYLKADNPMAYPDPKVFNDEIVRLGGDNYRRGQGYLFAKLRSQGYDAVVLGDTPGERVWAAFRDRTQFKSALGNTGAFSTAKASISLSPRQAITKPGVGVSDENMHDFAPGLRVRVKNPPQFETRKSGAPMKLMQGETTNKNATQQLANLDMVLEKYPDPTASPEAWSEMMAYALGSNEVPVPPYAFIKDINSGGAARKVSGLSEGQIADANHGFEQAADFRKAYEDGEISVATTGKLFLWSFLSRGVSPYTQEGLFIDAFDGADHWIQKAARGEFTEADLPAYKKWTATSAPKGSGQPGSGAMHNLNAFGESFLLKMGKKDEEGITPLQRLHDMMSSRDMTGQQIRREFLKFGEGVGIDNKVVSFTLLVAGHSDVMVIDRVQTEQLWNDGRFDDINLYDGQKQDGKVITGTALSNLTYGARGLLAYEAVERALGSKIDQIYEAAGRPQDGSIGRYHWESWVAYSQQEASHGTLQAILSDAVKKPGDMSAIAGVTAKEGEYGAYAYGARYGRDADGNPFFLYNTPTGGEYAFSVPAFRAFLEVVKKPSTGVVPSKFLVTQSGNRPWYERPEVNQQKLDDAARKWADRSGEGALVRSGEGENLPGRSQRAGAASEPNAPGVKLSPRQRDDETFLAVRRIRANRTGDDGPSNSYARRSREDGGKPRLLKSLGVTYSADWTPGEALRKDMTGSGINVPLRVLELAHDDDNNAQKFTDAITRAKASSEHGASVAVYDPESYKNYRLLLSEDGKSGAAVKPDGDIVSVFASDKTGRAILEAAVAAGGRKLDAFDTILPKYYHAHGFIEAGRVKWDDSQAPEGWSKKTYAKFNHGEPDVVLMVLDRSDTSPILEKAPVFPTWDEAAEAQEKLLGKMSKEQPGAIVNLRLDRLDKGKAFTLAQAKEAVEQTGAHVIASRTRKINGAEGEPGVTFNLSRPLTAEEADKVAKDLKQEAIPQFAHGRGEVLGPKPEKYGDFAPEKFHTVDKQPLFSPRLTPEELERIRQHEEEFEARKRGREPEPKIPVAEPAHAPAPEPKPAAPEPAAPAPKEEPKATPAPAPKAQEPVPVADKKTLEAEATVRQVETASAAEPPPETAAEKTVIAAAEKQRALIMQHQQGKGIDINRALNGELTQRLANAPQQERAKKLVELDRPRAIRIAMRREQPPQSWNMLPSFVYMELERVATKEGDSALDDLLLTSPLAKEVTTAARLIQSLSTRDPLSAGSIKDSIMSEREAAATDKAEKTHGSLERAKLAAAKAAEPAMDRAIKAQIRKAVPPMEKIAELIKSLKCN